MKESQYLQGQEKVLKKIKAIPAFKAYSYEQLNDFLRLTKICEYTPNEIIILEGSRANRLMYFLLSGAVKVEKNGLIIKKIKKIGEVFGEMGFLADSPRTSTVKAIQRTVCLAINVRHLLKINEEAAIPIF